MQITGACQCGTLRYRLTAPPVMAYACHCTICQRISTSAFNISVICRADAVEITAGTPARHDWVADRDVKRFGEFCPACGVRIRHGHEPSKGVWTVRGGTLDDTRWARPAAHIWMKSAVPWFRPAPDDLLYDAQPEDYAAIIDRYQAIMGL